MERFRNHLPVAAALVAALALAGPALADTRIEKTLALDPGGRFVLHSDEGSVRISGASRSDVRIVIESGRDDLQARVDLEFEEGGDVARVTLEKHPGSGWLRGLSLRYTIEVPRSTAVDVQTAGGAIVASGIHGATGLRSSGGKIEIREVQGTVEARTSGGPIYFEDVVGNAVLSTSGGTIRGSNLDGPLEASTSGGSIALEAVSGDVKLETSGGGIDVAGAGGRVEAHTSGGPVSVAFVEGNHRGGNLRTSGGGIRVKLDPAANLDLDAHCSGGSVRTDLPVQVVGDLSTSTVRGSLGAGGATLKLRTSGGSIRIEAI